MKVAHLTTVDMSLRYLVLPQLLAVSEAGGEAVGISAPGPFVDELEDLGIRHIPLTSSTRGMNLMADLRAMREFWRVLRTERPDVLHTHNPKPGVYGRVLGRLAGVPIIVNTVHGLYATEDDPVGKRAIVYSLEAVASRFSDAELIQSPEDLELMLKWRMASRHRTELLGNGVDLRRFDGRRGLQERGETRASLGIADGDVVVGMVGRLVAEKGYRELFEAMALLDDGCRLIVIGPLDESKADGLTKDELQKAEQDGVAFLGMRTDMVDLYAAMDILVLPSHREGFPRAAMEAAAMGLPIVASNIRGCRQVVEDGVNGYLVPVRDPLALAGAIDRLASDPSLRAELGAAGRTRAEEMFDEAEVVRRVISSYARVARRKGLPWGPATGAHELRGARRSDVSAIAEMHRQAIRSGFLAKLGSRFLRLLYSEMVESPQASVHVIADEFDSPVGFVAGVENTRSFYRRFIRRRWLLAGWLLSLRMLRPSNLRRVFETLRYGVADDASAGAELLAMAVDEEIRGQGWGGQLGRRFLDDMRSRGVAGCDVVVGAGNQAAIAAYERMGFGDPVRLEVHRGEASVRLTWSP